MAHPQAELKAVQTESRCYFGEALDDAERLLKYAAEMGMAVDDAACSHILQARAARVHGWSDDIASNLLAALRKLAHDLHPVTASSLKSCASGPTVRKYWIVSLCLAVFIVPFSVASFVTSAISTTIKADIAGANELAVKLRSQLGPPGTPNPAQHVARQAYATAGIADSTIISELSQFATDIREIDAGARQLRVFLLFAEKDPFWDIRGKRQEQHDMFQLPEDLSDFAAAASRRTNVYQDVRYFGQSLVDDVAVFYGAMSACILPVLYALLGTCAYLLRNFEQQIAARTYTPSVADAPRFLIAGIGGAVVGLFNNFAIGQGASIPPLAIAFLVGYAVDVFFTFLEGLLHRFAKSSALAAAKQETFRQGRSVVPGKM